MRSESEIYSLINDIAVSDSRIRAVLLNGSRSNPKAVKDDLQDFDIVFMVENMDFFLKDPNWVHVFGDRTIMQMPDTMSFDEDVVTKNTSFAYLMLFKDGNRLDLTLFSVELMNTQFKRDSLTRVLLDKDGLFKNIEPSSDKDFWIKKPTEKEFLDHCNEFWWVSTYVAKGLARKEITYAKAMMDGPVRKMFIKILEWHIGIETGFSVSFGKEGKFIQQYVSSEMYKKILSTYPDADIDNIWDSLFEMCDLFMQFSRQVKNEFQFEYDFQEAENVFLYLEAIRKHQSLR